RLLVGPEVIAHQLILFPQVQQSVHHDRMRPGPVFLIFGPEPTVQAVLFGRRGDQCDGPVLVAEDDLPVDISNRGRSPARAAVAFTPPDDFAGLPGNAGREALSMLVS